MSFTSIEGFPNLALGRPANQSSFSMFSKGAVTEDDAAGGNNGKITGCANFHTEPDLPAWWMVDLRGLCRIARICIYNRLDYPERLRHFTILASLDGNRWHPIHQKTDDSDFGGADGRPFDLILDSPVDTRFLRVRQDDPIFLHFDEFQAFGIRLEPERPKKSFPYHPPPRLSGQTFVEFEEALELISFGKKGRHERAVLMQPLMPDAAIPARFDFEVHPIIAGEQIRYPPPPPVCVYAVADAQVWGNGITTYKDQFLILPDCLPAYFKDWIFPDKYLFPIPVLEEARWHRHEFVLWEKPIATVLNPNMVYGHFLLEMLPRLYVLSLLQDLGVDFTLALPTNLPGWMREFIDLYFVSDDILFYNPASDVLKAPSVIMPSMMHVEHNFHCAFNLMVADLQRRVGLNKRDVREAQTAAWGQRRIYLSRRQYDSNKRLTNEDEVEATMQELGFEIVHPQLASVRDQLALFDAADVVAGEYSSALHNTLFCRFGTRVISLNCYSWYQSAIGRLRRQPMGFVAPDDGLFRHWQFPNGTNRSYRIDPSSIKLMVAKIQSGSE